MSPELDELQEHAQHAAHNPSMAPVSVSMAILSVCLAVVTLLSVRSHTEEVKLQTKVNDTWAYYQGKDTRLHEDKSFADLSNWVAVSDAAKAAAWRAANQAEQEKYRKQEDDLQAEAKRLEEETEFEGRRGSRYEIGEILLEIALVVTSITLLSGKRIFWHAGLVLGAAGVLVACTAMLVH